MNDSEDEGQVRINTRSEGDIPSEYIPPTNDDQKSDTTNPNRAQHYPDYEKEKELFGAP